MTNLRHLLRSSRGQDILLFLVFVMVSYGVWMVLKLNDSSHYDFNVELKISDVPEGVHFISEVPENLHASILDKGLNLAKIAWGGKPQLKLKYTDFNYDEINDKLTLSRQSLRSQMRAIFGSNAQITATNPDSLSFIVTRRAPRKVKVIPDVDVTPVGQCVISGPVIVEPDSVLIYSPAHANTPPKTILTERLVRSEIKDTLSFELSILNSSTTKAEPAKVKVTIPVEPLMSKTRNIAVELINEPASGNVVLFPTKVPVSYLLPMSLFNAERGTVTVVADYSKRSANRIPIRITNHPKDYRAVEVSTDSVDYIFEQP